MSRYFPHNMGSADRALRVFVIAPAAIIAALAIGVPSVLGIVLLAVAAIGLATGASGIYRLPSPIRTPHSGTESRRRPGWCIRRAGLTLDL